jgi:hypothetical protein
MRCPSRPRDARFGCGDFQPKVTRPSTTENGLRATGIRFGDRRAMAVLEPILKFGHVIDGFTNRQVVKLTSRLLNEDHTSRQATYDLRRLRRKDLSRDFRTSNDTN